MLNCKDENKKTLEMIEGDFGQTFPIELLVEDSEAISSIDNFSIKIFKEINGELLVSKNYTDIQNATIEFMLSREDTLKLPVGTYYYDLDWYQGQNFMGNLIAKAKFIVNEKAGVPDES